MSGANGNGNGNGNGKLSAFTQRRGWKKWTAVNDPILWAIVVDPEQCEARMWALALLRSFGTPNDPQDAAVDPATGKRMRAADFGRELGVSRTTIQRWSESLAAQNRLHVTEDGVYAVDDPARPFKFATSCNGSPLQLARKYKKYIDRVWSDSEDAKREKALRSELKTLQQKKLNGYKEWLRIQESVDSEESDLSRESVTNADLGAPTSGVAVTDSQPAAHGLLAAPYIRNARAEEEDSYIERSSSSSSSSSPEPAAAENPTTTTIPALQKSPTPQEAQGLLMIRLALKAHGTPDPGYESRLWADARQADPKLHALELVHVIDEKVPLCRGKGFPYLTAAVLRALPVDRNANLERAMTHQTPDELVRWKAEQSATLDDPNVSEQEKHLIRLCLGLPQ